MSDATPQTPPTPPPPDAARIEAIAAYHRRSKHHLDRFARGPRGLDWATQPDPFRTYAGAPRVALPHLADDLDVPFAALRTAGTVAPPRPFDAEGIGLLFELSLGLSAWKSIGRSRWALRCNPSSGNLHPTEGYLVTPALPGIPAGVHHYVSCDHCLEQRAAPSGEAWSRAWPAPGVAVALTSIHWREAWKYGERAYRYCQHDAGHALAAVRYAAAALGWSARVVPHLSDGELARILGLDRAGDRAGAEPEAPDLLLWISAPEAAEAADALDADALGAALAGATWRGRANALSPHRRDWGLDVAEEAAATGDRGLVGARWRAPARPPAPDPTIALGAATLFRQRRSAVDFDGVTRLSRADFLTALDACLPRPGVAPFDALGWEPRIHPLVFVHRVDDLEPGLYLFARRDGVAERLRPLTREGFAWERVPDTPDHLRLYCLHRADVREVAQLVSCHQAIGADSAFAIAMLAEFSGSLARGAWWYRLLHWEAGALGQVLYLEAEAAGLRATGIGCFFDDALHHVLGLDDETFQTLYHFTVGGPVADPRLRSEPGYPAGRRGGSGPGA